MYGKEDDEDPREYYFRNGEIVVDCVSDGVVIPLCLSSDAAYDDSRILYKF